MSERISILCSKIANKDLVLPEFQREFTWRKDQSRDLIDSLLKEYPTGSLLFWKTKESIALKNMPKYEPEGLIEVLLDGQQRLTVLYMLLRDDIPPYYSGEDIEDGKDPRNLYYNIENRDLKYYKEIEMGNNPYWVRVCDCFKNNKVSVPEIINEVDQENINLANKISNLHQNLNALTQIRQVEYPIMFVGEEANLNHALTVFDRVNSKGTPLSEADIALAHLCSAWPKTRRVFKEKLEKLNKQGFEFDLTFLARAMNAVVNGRAEYHLLHNLKEEQIAAGWNVLDNLLDYVVNFLRDRAYIYGTNDLNTSNVLIPLLGYLSKNELKFQSESDRKKLLFWIYAALFQRRYSGSVDQKLSRDLSAIETNNSVDSLLAVLKEDEGDPVVTPESLDTRGVGHPLYNMSCIVIRANDGVDWSNGLKLGRPFGSSYSIQRHHVFPKSLLKDAGYDSGNNLIHQKRVNEIANRVPMTQSGNLDIFNTPPEQYLEVVENNNPGNLQKFMIPTDSSLWEIENYEQFLAKRRKLIAKEINNFMEDLIKNSNEKK
ncbi:MAG: GmrSD restriction endonuclease domain-containing protein, partial [Candidatus Woesearchaeota archaeon]